MEITAQMVSQLREQTGAGMMECKKALVESGGDIERARDILRAKGQAGAEKRVGRAAADGVVAAVTSPSASSLIELNSETDFVARNEEFKALAHQIATAAAGHPHEDVAAILALTIDGKTIKEKIDDALGKMRENLVLRRTIRYEAQPDSVLSTYIHTVTNKIGVLVELKGDPGSDAQKEIARGIAMHIAASKPEYVRREDVPADVVEREKAVLAEKTRIEGKPEAAIPKIVEGRVGKFFEQICLLEQPYVRDPSKKISQLLSEAGLEARRFTLYQVGQE
jgi:elongation factor Ts